jgi:hypothetical protein
MNEKETQHGGIGTILIYVTKKFHMRMEGYNLCKYKTQGLSETFVMLHHHSCKGLLTQNMQ